MRRATLVFLAVPAAIFLAGWLWVPLAAVSTAVLGWGVWRTGWGTMVGEEWTAPGGGEGGPGLRAWLLGGLLPAVALVGMSGAGGWGSGDSDWFKHDTILRDLIERPWPVTYQTSAGPVFLVYYVSFYLPAALVGKLTGSWFLAGQALALTMLVGMLLSLGWLWLLGGGGARGGWWRAVGVFFLFSGMDVVGKAAVNLRLGLPVGYGDWNDIEWWAQVFQYSANPSTLFWVPHQALGAWLPTALWLEGALQPRRAGVLDPAETWGLTIGLAVLWSPFAALGLLPLTMGKGWGGRFWRLGAVVSPANLAGAVLVVVGAGYYFARLESYRVPAWAEVTPGFAPTPLIEGDGVSLVTVYLAFVLLEFGFLAAALAWSFRPGERAGGERTLLALTVGTLLLLPLKRYGFANDLVMRGGIPALFVLQVLALRALQPGAGRRRSARWMVTALLAIGALTSGLEYRRHLARMVRDHALRDDSARTPVQSLFQLQRGLYHRPDFDFARQYLGSTDGFYARHLAPAGRPAPRPVAEE